VPADMDINSNLIAFIAEHRKIVDAVND